MNQIDFWPSTGPGEPGLDQAFADWLREDAAKSVRRPSSIEVYRHMWVAFSRGCRASGVTADSLQADDLERHLMHRGQASDLSAIYAQRLLRLVERVLAARSRREGEGVVFTAVSDLLARRPEWRYANSRNRQPLPEVLSPREAARLVRLLRVAMQQAQADPLRQWALGRNAATVAAMLGAGMAPGEVRSLSIRHVGLARTGGEPSMLRVPADGKIPAHSVPMTRWAARLMRDWLSIRAGLQIPGEQVFVSARTTGKPLGKVAMYNAVRDLLGQAGVLADDGGSFRLRHTFAVRRLRAGHTTIEVAAWLGLKDVQAVERYQALL